MSATGSLTWLVIAAMGLSSAACIGVSQTRSAAGSGSAGGSDLKVCRENPRPAEDGEIDDFEDGNTQISLVAGRDGYWWTKKDTKGSTVGPDPFAPSDGGADGSEMALRGMGITVSGDGDAWGAGFGMNLLSQKAGLYDASKYAGITFKAKVGAKSTRQVRFKIGDVNTHADPGICTSCWNHFGKDFTLAPVWKEYRVLFSEARQEPFWGDPRPATVTPSKLVSIDWSIAGGQTYDIWIDDVRFLDCN